MPVDLFKIRVGPDRWESLEQRDRDRLQQSWEAFEPSLPADPVQRNLALANFYGRHKLELLQIRFLDEALAATRGQPDPQIALELADALRVAGYHEAAAMTYQYVPQIISPMDVDKSALLGRALQNQARSLEALGRVAEADATFAIAEHTLAAVGRIR